MSTLLYAHCNAAGQTFDCGHNDGSGIAVDAQLDGRAGAVTARTLERSRRLRGEHGSNERDQSIGQSARFTDLRRCPLGERRKLFR